MKNNIEWIFFDVGSTLVNEEKVYCHRLQDIADAAGEPFEKIYNMAIDLYKNNKKGDLELTRKYKVSGSKWYLEEEELFGDTEETLKALSPKYKIGIIANQSLGVLSVVLAVISAKTLLKLKKVWKNLTKESLILHCLKLLAIRKMR